MNSEKGPGEDFLKKKLCGEYSVKKNQKYSYVTVSKHYIEREYVYSVAVYQKYLTKLGQLIIFEPRYLFLIYGNKLSFLPTSLHILIYGNTIYVFYLSFSI